MGIDWAATAAWAQFAAGLATFGAAGLAVRAAYEAPKKAAEFAESLRRQSVAQEDERRVKLNVLGALLKYRAQIGHPDSVEALNLVEFAFIDEQAVRTSFRHFMDAAHTKPFSNDKLSERHRALIENITRALGLGGKLSIQDIERFYWPETLALRVQLDEQEVSLRLRALQPSANAQVQTTGDDK